MKVKYLQFLVPFATGIVMTFIAITSSKAQQPDFSEVPGTVIAHVPAETNTYIGSPSICIMPNGDYMASHDFFGTGDKTAHIRIYRSTDEGKSWGLVTEIPGFWSTLFYHQEALYLMGTTKEYGSCVIRKSMDCGETWTEPVDGQSGLLFAEGEYHTAPMPVLAHNGRVWRSMEDRNPPKSWGVNFRTFVISAPDSADLLKADNWTASNRLGFDQGWLGEAWLEGNLVVSPEGKIWNILRHHQNEKAETAAMVEVSEDGKKLKFDPETGFIEFPGGSKKFLIRYDEVSGKYWALSNIIPDKHLGGNPERTRNTLALMASSDLKEWEIKTVVLYKDDVKYTGFQYPDWQFDDKDLIVVVRTAFEDGMGGAKNCHDANMLTFHRIKNFRKANNYKPKKWEK